MGKGGGKGGWGKGVGEGGWNLYLNEVFYKTGIATSDEGVVTHVTTRNRTRIVGNPRFLGEYPCNDIMFSKIRHNLAKKNSENEKARDFT